MPEYPDFTMEITPRQLPAAAGFAQAFSTKEFCAEWKSKWRLIAVSAQAVLKILFPPGAAVLGYLISIADGVCSTG